MYNIKIQNCGLLSYGTKLSGYVIGKSKSVMSRVKCVEFWIVLGYGKFWLQKNKHTDAYMCSES